VSKMAKRNGTDIGKCSESSFFLTSHFPFRWYRLLCFYSNLPLQQHTYSPSYRRTISCSRLARTCLGIIGLARCWIVGSELRGCGGWRGGFYLFILVFTFSYTFFVDYFVWAEFGSRFFCLWFLGFGGRSGSVFIRCMLEACIDVRGRIRDCIILNQ
jgi:hypothetical protein